MTALDRARRDAALVNLPDWSYDPTHDALVRELRFADFDEAFAFMTRVALIATRLDHHPEWSNVYNRVTIRLRTHDCDGVSEKDVALASAVDMVLG